LNYWWDNNLANRQNHLRIDDHLIVGIETAHTKHIFKNRGFRTVGGFKNLVK